MTANIAEIVEQIEEISSPNDLIFLQEKILNRFRTLIVPEVETEVPAEAAEKEAQEFAIPGLPLVKYTKEDAERRIEHLKSLLPPEDRDKFGTTDLSKLTFGEKSFTQRLIEDREEERY
jgi:hypothetical protein